MCFEFHRAERFSNAHQQPNEKEPEDLVGFYEAIFQGGESFVAAF